MSRMRCTELAKYGDRSVIEVMDMDTEKVIKYVLAYDFNNARPYGEKWENGDYYNVDDILGLKADEQLKAAMLKLYDIKEPEIPYDRLAMFANEFLGYVDVNGISETLKNCLNISEDEAEFFGIKDTLFPKKYKVVEVTFARRQYTTVKVIMPDEVETYNVEDYVDNQYYLEAEESEDWECEDYNVLAHKLTEEKVRDDYDLDEIWNGCDFPDYF